LESLNAKRAAIIYNPVARGLARRLHLLQRTIEILQQRGIEASLVGTTAPGTASALARAQIDAGCDLIIAAGGDGTINEVANGMLDSGVPMAILPGGTANVLAREMGVPINLEKAAKQIPDSRVCRIGVGTLTIAEDKTPRCFLCMAGAGLDAEIVAGLNIDLKAAIGKFAYYIGGFSQVFRPLREFEVVVDGERYLASFALVSRVRNYGGDLEIAKGASLLREDFEIVLFRGTVSLQYIPYLAGVALKFAEKMKGVTFVRGRSVACQIPDGARIYAQVDGELAGTLPMKAEFMPEAISLVAPAAYRKKERSRMAVPALA
jgi:YegS/Rv2252/BmrU family lipid kinase